jgi:hypothetical protein
MQWWNRQIEILWVEITVATAKMLLQQPLIHHQEMTMILQVEMEVVLVLVREVLLIRNLAAVVMQLLRLVLADILILIRILITTILIAMDVDCHRIFSIQR